MKWLPPSGFWTIRGLPEPLVEFRFHPNRLWRFDFYWPGKMVALEIDGGYFFGGRHSRGAGQMKDNAKMNEARRMGFSVFHFTPEQIRNDMEVERYPKKYKFKRETVSEFLQSVLL